MGRLLTLLHDQSRGLPREGLLAEYRFDEGSGQVLFDYSGNGNHGTLGATSGAESTDPAWSEQGLVFTPSPVTYVLLPALLDPGISDVSAAIRLTANSLPDVGGATHQFLSQQDGTGTGRTWMMLHGSLGNKLTTVIGGDSNNDLSDFVPTVGVTVTLGFSLDTGTDTLVWYIDGEAHNTVTGVTASSADGSLVIGSSKALTVSCDATIAGLVVYDRVLTDAEWRRVHRYLKLLSDRRIGVSSLSGSAEYRWITSRLAQSIASG